MKKEIGMLDAITPTWTKFILYAAHINGGGQIVFRFPNNYGASVVRHSYSYGKDKGLFELAVIKFSGEGEEDWEITYQTPITDDVLGYLSVQDVEQTLGQIIALED